MAQSKVASCHVVLCRNGWRSFPGRLYPGVGNLVTSTLHPATSEGVEATARPRLPAIEWQEYLLEIPAYDVLA